MIKNFISCQIFLFCFCGSLVSSFAEEVIFTQESLCNPTFWPYFNRNYLDEDVFIYEDIDINEDCNDQGITPFMYALWFNNDPDTLFSLFWRFCGDVKKADRFGESARDIAELRYHHALIFGNEESIANRQRIYEFFWWTPAPWHPSYGDEVCQNYKADKGRQVSGPLVTRNQTTDHN